MPKPNLEDDREKIPIACLEDEELNWIWIGDREDARDLQLLKQKNIKYILNCTPTRTEGGVPNYYEKDPTMSYCRLAMLDNSTQLLSKHYEAAWEFFEKVRSREDGGVLVHCNMGVSRSTSMVCAYVMKHYQYSFDDILAQCQKVRSCCCPTSAFMEELRQFSEHLAKTGDYVKIPKKKRKLDGGLTGGANKKRIGVQGPPRETKGPSIGPAGPVVGPSIGPAGPSVGPSIGPARPGVGPAARPAVGPSIGPAGPAKKGPVGPEGPPRVTVGPARPPTAAIGPSRP